MAFVGRGEHVRAEQPGRSPRPAGVTTQASWETGQHLRTDTWGPKAAAGCSVVLCTLRVATCAFNKWCLVGAGLCLRP